MFEAEKQPGAWMVLDEKEQLKSILFFKYSNLVFRIESNFIGRNNLKKGKLGYLVVKIFKICFYGC